MQITPIKHGLELGLSAPGYVRSPGLHASDLYGSLYAALEPKRYGTGKPMDMLRIELGMAFEEMLERSIKSRLLGERPGEFTAEEEGKDIIFSPDMIFFEGKKTIVGEFKLSWQSSRSAPRTVDVGFPPKMDKFITQMALYCRWLDTKHARLIVFYVNGAWDHSKGFSPEILAWDIEFSQQELDEQWAMVRNHARHLGLL